MHDFEFRLTLWIDLNPNRACRVRPVGLQELVSDPEAKQRISHFASQLIRADAAGDNRTTPQQMRAVREVCGGAAKLSPGRQEVPQDFAETDDSWSMAHAVQIGSRLSVLRSAR